MRSTTVTARRSPGAPEDVLEHIADGDDLIVPLANGEPVSVLDAIEAHADRWHGRAHPPDARAARPALPPRRDRRPPRSRLVLPVAGDAAGVPRAGLRARAQPLQRGAPASCGRRTRCSLVLAAAAPMDAPRLLLAGHQLRLRGAVHRAACRSSSRSTSGCRGPSAPTRSTSARSSGGPRWTDRSSRCRRPRHRPVDERIAAHVAPRIPDGATIQAGIGVDPERPARGPARPPGPRRAHRAALRRAHRPHRARRGHRHPQAARAAAGP